MKKLLLLSGIILLVITTTGCHSGQPVNSVLTPEDAVGRDIGVLYGSSSFRFADSIGEVRVYTKPSDLIESLKIGALDCIFMEREPAEAIVTQTSGVKILPDPYCEIGLSFAVAKENADLTRDINNAIIALTENGTLQGLRERHILSKEYTYVPPNIEKRGVTLTLAAPEGFPPYTYKNENGVLVGLDIDTAQAICDYLGIDLIVELTPTSDLKTNVQFGWVDLAVGYMYDNETDREIVDFSDPYTVLSQVLIVRR